MKIIKKAAMYIVLATIMVLMASVDWWVNLL